MPAPDNDIDEPYDGPGAYATQRQDTPVPSSGLEEEPIPLVSLKPSRAAPNLRQAMNGAAAHDADNELLGALFERMHELSFAPSLGDGAEFVLSVLADTIPCAGVIIHVIDPVDHQLVVVRAHGPNSQRILLSRTPQSEPRLEPALRQQGSTPSPPPVTRHHDPAATATLWQRLGVTVQHSLCGPSVHTGSLVALIELANPTRGGDFHEDEINALDYICDQFADFVAERPVGFD
jgi:hypothetical protein